jgi:hypothetical protein
MKTAAILIGVLVGLRVVIIILAVLAILYLLMIINISHYNITNILFYSNFFFKTYLMIVFLSCIKVK